MAAAPIAYNKQTRKKSFKTYEQEEEEEVEAEKLRFPFQHPNFIDFVRCY